MSTLKVISLQHPSAASPGVTINTSNVVISGLTTGSMPSGAWTLLNTLTASSSAALSDTSNFTSSYAMYAIVFENIFPATNAVGLNMTLQSGGSFQASSYSGATNLSNSGTSAHTPGGAFSTAISLTSGARLSTTASGGFDGILYLPDPAQTTSYKQIWGHGVYWDNASTTYSGWNTYCAWRGGTGAITGVQFAMSSGNIASGSIRIYGVRT